MVFFDVVIRARVFELIPLGLTALEELGQAEMVFSTSKAIKSWIGKFQLSLQYGVLSAVIDGAPSAGKVAIIG